MAQTKIGGLKAMNTNKTKYGLDFYREIGKIGGSKKVPKGFAMMDKDKVREAGRLGGKISKRTSKAKK